MKLWLSLYQTVLVVVLFVIVEGVFTYATVIRRDSYWNPPPNEVSVQYVRALIAHRFPAARDQLTGDAVITPFDLRDWLRHVEKIDHLKEAHPANGQMDGDHGEAVVHVERRSGEAEQWRFKLRREGGFWKILSPIPAQL